MPINVIKSPTLSQHRDLRSTSVPYKREKDHNDKRSQYGRPNSSLLLSSAGHIENNVIRKTEEMQPKSLLSKPWNTSHKTSKMAKTGWSTNRVNSRANTRNNVDIDDTDSLFPDLSYSLSQQLSSYDAQEHNVVHTEDLGFDNPDPLYSFDNKGPSPGVNGRSVELEKLVEIAEKKWEGKVTERIVEGEYEVLDGRGENITLTKKSRKNTKQKSRSLQIRGSSEAVDEDDGFELI